MCGLCRASEWASTFTRGTYRIFSICYRYFKKTLSLYYLCHCQFHSDFIPTFSAGPFHSSFPSVDGWIEFINRKKIYGCEFLGFFNQIKAVIRYQSQKYANSILVCMRLGERQCACRREILQAQFRYATEELRKISKFYQLFRLNFKLSTYHLSQSNHQKIIDAQTQHYAFIISKGIDNRWYLIILFCVLCICISMFCFCCSHVNH